MADESGFDWVGDEELAGASREELIAHILDLQDDVEDLQHEVDELRDLLYFLLDVQAGIATETHPELAVFLEAVEENKD